MQVLTRIADVRTAVKAAKRDGKRVGFVPTMGYLHEGHQALMAQARQECDVVIVSIFVNPKQFGPNEDFARYPRDLERDKALCEAARVDYIFAPTVEEMYPEQYFTSVSVAKLTEGLCGASRPGHFDGVATVVSKLFNIVAPDRAYFGEKDAQQVAVIRRMVADLNMDLDIRPVATVREADGLAKSSRNVFLSADERERATVLFKSMQLAQAMVTAGERDLTKIRAAMVDLIQTEPLAAIDYVSLVDYDTLQPVERLDGKVLAALAVKFGKTRLIDNCVLEA